MIGVLRRNPEFKRLWLAQIVSYGGDWLSHIAVLSLIGRLSGGEAAFGVGVLYAAELALRFLPVTVLGPLAGPVADRVPRRFMMITADVVRAVVVLALLFVRDADDLPLLYALIAAQMGTGIFFESARSGAMPNTVDRADLHEAYALTAASWSIMLAVGALVGGVLVEAIGTNGVFVADAATYLLSAALIVGLRLPPVPVQEQPFRWIEILTLADMRRGLAHVRELGLLHAVLAKTFWGPVGGFLVVIAVAANDRFGDGGESAAFALGVFYAARGVGTGLGPVLGRKLFGSGDAGLRTQISLGFAVASVGYAAFAFTDHIVPAAACVAFAHMGGSSIWIASTTLWQKHVDDAFRGRIFAFEFLVMTFSFSTLGLLTGWLYDFTLDVPVTTWAVCGAVVVLGGSWHLIAARAGPHG